MRCNKFSNFKKKSIQFRVKLITANIIGINHSKMKEIFKFVINFILLISFSEGKFSGDLCLLNNDTQGVCKNARDCTWAVEGLSSHTLSYKDLVKCGFEGLDSIICCKEPKVERVETKTRKQSDIACEIINQRPVSNVLQVEREIPIIPGDFPFIAALGNYNEEHQKYQYFCGGSLISNEFLLTTASCVENHEHIPTIVKFGAISLSENYKFAEKEEISMEQTVGIQQIIVHPEYSSTNHHHNIALVRLTRPVSYSSLVYPGCVHTNFTEMGGDQELSTLGWGEASINDESFQMIYSVKSKSIETFECLDKLGPEVSYNMQDEQFCGVNDVQNNEQINICQLNDGGPILLKVLDKNYIVGLKSFNWPCNFPISAVYTKIADYIDWLDFIVWPGSVEF